MTRKDSTIIPRPNGNPTPITIPYFPAFSDAIAQTAVPTVVPPAKAKNAGRYSIVNGR